MGTSGAPKRATLPLRIAGTRLIIPVAGIVCPCLRARSAAPVHRFGRSRIVSAPPAARTDHGLFKARTPARPEGASFGAVGKDLPAASFFLGAANRRIAASSGLGVPSTPSP